MNPAEKYESIDNGSCGYRGNYVKGDECRRGIGNGMVFLSNENEKEI
jgi:hypothetical protein